MFDILWRTLSYSNGGALSPDLSLILNAHNMLKASTIYLDKPYRKNIEK